MSIQYRSEHESVGERSVPKDVYYGVQSLRAAEKAGYRPEGLARRYLNINGVWEDHIHMVKLNEEEYHA